MRRRRLALAWLAAAGLLALAPRGASASPGAGPDGEDGSSLAAEDGDPDAGGGDEDGAGGGADREAPPPGSAARVAGPSVGEVLAAAYRAAGLDRDPARGWSRRARVAGLIPLVTVRTGRNTSWQELDPDVDRGATLEVRATWHLDRLLFDGRELQIASIDAARRRERRLLGSRVIRAYFGWRRMAGAARVHPRWTPRAEEAAAELDALTDGWFSGQLDRARRRATTSARGQVPSKRSSSSSSVSITAGSPSSSS